MRLSILITAGVLCCAVPANADYDYVIEDGYSEGLTLNDYETLLMTGGGVHVLDVFDYSHAEIWGTTPYIDEHNGGIWMLTQAGYSFLDFLGGEIHEFYIASYATARFSGGRIDEIWSYQTAWMFGGDPPELVPDPHIEIVCLDWDWDDITNVLTGTWADFSTFDIQLVDRVGYDPVIENISFTIVPEPASLLLIAAGGLMLRRRI
jgi:hypothetical protein